MPARVTRKACNAICGALPSATHVVQWGGADVWKVAGKVFAIVGEADDGGASVSFKVSELSFAVMKDEPGMGPAPYLASRGFTWIQDRGGLARADLAAYLAESHRLVAAGLTQASRRKLGLA